MTVMRAWHCAMALALALAGLLVSPGSAGAQSPDPRATTHIRDFPDCCPRPAWWDEVETETHIGTLEEFLAIWQDSARSDKQKAKAMFRAIEEFVRRDDDITAAAVTYYYWVDRDYPHILRLYQFGAGRFLDYDRPLENYGGMTGDMSAGIVNTLAKLYLRGDEPGLAVPWLQYILTERADEVNDHLLETAAEHLGHALSRVDRDEEAIDVLTAAIREYDGDWEARLEDRLAEIRGKIGLSYYLHDTRGALPLLGLLLVAIVGLMVWRRRRPGRPGAPPGGPPAPD